MQLEALEGAARQKRPGGNRPARPQSKKPGGAAPRPAQPARPQPPRPGQPTRPSPRPTQPNRQPISPDALLPMGKRTWSRLNEPLPEGSPTIDPQDPLSWGNGQADQQPIIPQRPEEAPAPVRVQPPQRSVAATTGKDNGNTVLLVGMFCVAIALLAGSGGSSGLSGTSDKSTWRRKRDDSPSKRATP
jgi:hypothetical protein